MAATSHGPNERPKLAGPKMNARLERGGEPCQSLLNSTSSEAAEQVRNGSLSPGCPSRVTAPDRIDSLERLNAWITIDREDVLLNARQREEDVAQGRTLGPMHGIPVGLKDIYYTAGMKTTANSKVYADFVPDFDATSVRKMKEAGAIVLGKAMTTEFATSDPSIAVNPLPPRTHRGRLQQRVMRGRGFPHVLRSPWLPDRGLHRAPRCLQRHRRPQGHLRAHKPCWRYPRGLVAWTMWVCWCARSATPPSCLAS